MSGLAQNRRPVGARSLAGRAAAASSLGSGLRRALADGTIGRLILLVPDPHARFAAVELDRRFVAEEALDGGYGMCSYVPTMSHFLAGVLRDARALTAIWAPTWNSYVRLRTAPFSPGSLRWGVDDRTAAVRIAGSGRSLRVEFRFAGADAQPHLVVAARLAAGRAGIAERLPLPPAGRAVGALANTPWDALSALTGGRVAELMGDEVVAQQAALLESEIYAGCDAVTKWQRDRGAFRS